MLPLSFLLTTLAAGLLLAAFLRLRSHRPICPAFTRWVLDDKAEHHWDGRSSQPIGSRYDRVQ